MRLRRSPSKAPVVLSSSTKRAIRFWSRMWSRSWTAKRPTRATCPFRTNARTGKRVEKRIWRRGSVASTPPPGGRLVASQRGEALLKTVGAVAAGLKDVRQGSLGCAADFYEIDVEQLAALLAEATGDHDRIHLSALGRVDNGADCVVGGEQADVVGADHDQIGLLAWCERADTVIQSGAAGPVDRRRFEDVLNRHRSRRMCIARI